MRRTSGFSRAVFSSDTDISLSFWSTSSFAASRGSDSFRTFAFTTVAEFDCLTSSGIRRTGGSEMNSSKIAPTISGRKNSFRPGWVTTVGCLWDGRGQRIHEGPAALVNALVQNRTHELDLRTLIGKFVGQETTDGGNKYGVHPDGEVRDGAKTHHELVAPHVVRRFDLF